MSGEERRSLAGPSPSYADLLKVRLLSVVGACHKCLSFCSPPNSQNDHESSATAGPVPGFGDEGQPIPHKVISGLIGGFQGAS